MITYPSVTTVPVVMTVAGIPFLRKSDEERYRLPFRTQPTEKKRGQRGKAIEGKGRGMKTNRENLAER